MPRAGPLLRWEASRESEDGGPPVIVLSYRERGTGRGGTFKLTSKGARTLARVLDGTRRCADDDPVEVFIQGEVLSHVG